MFAVGFGLGSQFAYFVYIMSCTRQQKGICHAFCKMLRNKSPYQTAKKRSDAVGPKSKEIKVKFFSFLWLGFPTFLSAFPNEFWISLNLCSLVWKMTFPMNFKGTLCHKTC